jgi:mRNA-degrading endonuclease toxin of MazEF toxin-antitoxin module
MAQALSRLAHGVGHPSCLCARHTCLRHVNDPTHLRLLRETPEGQHAGLLQDSVASCTNLATVHADRLYRVIGSLPDAVMHRVEECLKAALGLR